LHILWVVGLVFRMALVDGEKDGWVVVLFGCWLDLSMLWQRGECHVGVELHVLVLVMARDFHFEGSEWTLPFVLRPSLAEMRPCEGGIFTLAHCE
jgi:hypothetical protein